MLALAMPIALLLAADPPVPPPVLEELSVVAPEPRFAAPTRRDRIGRIWAPVTINGQGPFRLVLDTGATHSAITAKLAESLGVAAKSTRSVMLRGATGSVIVPSVPIESLEVGDLLMYPRRLPIVPDALGGAEGILGTDALGNKRIHIDFRRDSITIVRSRNEKAGDGFATIPFELTRGRLLAVDAHVGGVRASAIIDTGGQLTLGNVALRDALAERRKRMTWQTNQVAGVTLDVQMGDRGSTPVISIGGQILVHNAEVTFADFAVFEHWKMTKEPALMIGMDVLGLLDTLIIDYRRHELQVKTRRR